MRKITKILSFAFVVLFAGLVLAGCMPASVEKAEAKMEKAGYIVTAYDKVNDVNGFVGAFMAVNAEVSSGVEVNGMVAVLFKTNEDATKFRETWTGEYDGEAKYQDGKWVYTGSEKAIEDFKK